MCAVAQKNNVSQFEMSEMPIRDLKLNFTRVVQTVGLTEQQTDERFLLWFH